MSAQQKAKPKQRKARGNARPQPMPKPPARAPKPKRGAKPRAPANAPKSETPGEAFRREMDAAGEPGPDLPSLTADVGKIAEEQVYDAIRVVTKDPLLAALLGDARAAPKFFVAESSEWLPIDDLINITNHDNGPEYRNDPTFRPWPKLCDGDGRVRVKRGRAERRVPARDLLAWLRGDKKIVKPRQAELPGDDPDTLVVSESGGAKHYLRQRKIHDFEANDYVVSMTEGQLGKFRDAGTTSGKRLRTLDAKMRLKKEVDEYPGDEHRASAMKELLALVLRTDDEATEAESSR